MKPYLLHIGAERHLVTAASAASAITDHVARMARGERARILMGDLWGDDCARMIVSVPGLPQLDVYAEPADDAHTYIHTAALAATACG